MINQVTFPESKAAWDKAAASNPLHAPFFTWEWHNDWYQTLASGWKPFPLVIDEVIIAPFARRENEILFSGGNEIADYLDLIGPDGRKPSAWEAILPYLHAQGITSMRLRNIPEDSSTVAFFQKLDPAVVNKEDTTPVLTLPASWDIYKESLDRKYRHELERKIRKFDREHPDAQLIESTDPAGDLPILFDLMEKDDEKKAFLTAGMKNFFTAIARTFAQNISFLSIALGDKKIASTLSFIYKDTEYLYNSGFDKACCANAGFYLKSQSVKRAIEKELKTYNFLQGTERYKYELGAKDFGVYTVSINHAVAK